MEPKRLPPPNSMDPLVGRTCVIDTETTGTDTKVDRVISFGYVELVDGRITDRKELFFNPGDTPIHPEALKVHGITSEFLADKPPIKPALPLILGMLAEAILCGHHVKFDIDMLDAELSRHNLPKLGQFITGIYDTAVESKRRWPGKLATLDALCARAGVSTARRVKHGALVDAELCAEALIAMSREQKELLGIDSFASPDAAAMTAAEPLPPVLVLAATDEEIAAHELYLTGMLGTGVSPIWRQAPEPRIAAEPAYAEEPEPAATMVPA